MLALQPGVRQTRLRKPDILPTGLHAMFATTPANMRNTLQDQKIATVLDRMYAEAMDQMSLLRASSADFARPMNARERADAMSEFSIPVTPEAGRLLYALVRATRPATIVEFGMSFGVSAIHLASAVRYVSFNFNVRDDDSMEISCRTGD